MWAWFVGHVGVFYGFGVVFVDLKWVFGSFCNTHILGLLPHNSKQLSAKVNLFRYMHHLNDNIIDF